MAAPNIRRISTTNADAPEQLAGLRARLGAHGDLVSARNRELTQKVFGEALPPAKVVERVCNDVRSRGLAALLHYTEQFDKIQLGADTLRVKMSELNAAHAAADSAYLELVRRVRQNILSFQCGLLHRDAVLTAA